MNQAHNTDIVNKYQNKHGLLIEKEVYRISKDPVCGKKMQAYASGH